MKATPSIDELAKAAIEAQRKYTNTRGADLPLDEVRELRNIWLRALDAFRSSISPEAWLSLSSRVEALEGEYERGLEAAAKKADQYARNAEYRAAGYDNKEAIAAAHDKMEAGLDIAASIRSALSTPKPDGEK